MDGRRTKPAPEARCVCDRPIIDHQPLRQAWYIVQAWIQHRAVMVLGVILGRI